MPVIAFLSHVIFLIDSFVVSNKPGDGKRFLRILVKVSIHQIRQTVLIPKIIPQLTPCQCTEILDTQQEKQDLAERVMVTRLHLYGKWIKVFNLT